ncbi:hypothetical protein KKH3_05600 [Pectobacterium actinidiae]|nr:hypothetical protein KKH3_05600 [Pectobacterium actinidiae]
MQVLIEKTVTGIVGIFRLGLRCLVVVISKRFPSTIRYISGEVAYPN